MSSNGFDPMTYEDVDATRAEVADMLERFDSDDRLDPHVNFQISELLKAESDEESISKALGAGEVVGEYELDHAVRIRNSGTDLNYYTAEGNGFLSGRFGPVSVKDTGEILWTSIGISPDVRGDAIREKHQEIMESNDAPYLEPGLEREDAEKARKRPSIYLGRLSVPVDYEEEELEASYEAMMNRLSEAERLQDHVKSSVNDFEV